MTMLYILIFPLLVNPQENKLMKTSLILMILMILCIPIMSDAEEDPFEDFPPGGEPAVFPEPVTSNLPEVAPFGGRTSLNKEEKDTVLFKLDVFKAELRSYLEENNWHLSQEHIDEAVTLYNSLLVHPEASVLGRDIPDNIVVELESLNGKLEAIYESSLSAEQVEKLYKMSSILSWLDKVRLGTFVDRVSVRGNTEDLDYLLYVDTIESLLEDSYGSKQYGLPHLNTWANKNTNFNPLVRLLVLERITPVIETAAEKITFLEPYLEETHPYFLEELIEQYVAIGNNEAKSKLLIVAQNATKLSLGEIVEKATNAANKIP